MHSALISSRSEKNMWPRGGGGGFLTKEERKMLTIKIWKLRKTRLMQYPGVCLLMPHIHISIKCYTTCNKLNWFCYIIKTSLTEKYISLIFLLHFKTNKTSNWHVCYKLLNIHTRLERSIGHCTEIDLIQNISINIYNETHLIAIIWMIMWPLYGKTKT